MALPTKFLWIVHSLQKSWRWYVWHSALTLLLFSGLKRGFCLTLHTPFTMYPGEIYRLRAKAILLTTWKWPLLRYGNAPSSALVNRSSCLSLLFNSLELQGTHSRHIPPFLDVFCCSLFLQMLKTGGLWYTEILTVAVVEDTFLYAGSRASAATTKRRLACSTLWWLISGAVIHQEKTGPYTRCRWSRSTFLICVSSHLLTSPSFISITCSPKISGRE